MKLVTSVLILCLLIGCTPIERTAYNTAVAAKAFLDSIKTAHPECAQNPFPAGSATLCIDLQKATAAKDLLIDAIEGYCQETALPATSTAPCNPAPSGTAALTQFTNALNAALAGANQATINLKGIIQ